MPKASAGTAKSPVAAKAKRQIKPAPTKQEQVLAMLRRPDGATIDAIQNATGWQPHSVRGFFAGVVRKKLGLNLASGVLGDARVYRIVDKPKPNAARAA